MSEGKYTPCTEMSVGDMVLFYNDPINPCEPAMGWISRKPGTETVSILVWAESTGFLEKTSVRHRKDPFWRNSDSAAGWLRWGCWEPHPQTVALKEVAGLVTKMKVSSARKDDKAT